MLPKKLNVFKWLILSLVILGQAHAADQADIILQTSDPYEVLGLPKGATAAEVKAAHRRMAMRYHPDKPENSSNPKRANELLKRINVAKDRIDAGLSTMPDWAGNPNPSAAGPKAESGPAKPDSSRSGAGSTNGGGNAGGANSSSGAGGASRDDASVLDQFAKNYERATPERRKAMLQSLMRLGPNLNIIHELMDGISDKTTRFEIYRGILRAAKNPDQFIKLIAPLGLRPGNFGWSSLWKTALAYELPRFFQLNPTAEQIDILSIQLSVGYKGEGAQIFKNAAAGITPPEKGVGSGSSFFSDCASKFSKMFR